MSDCTKSPALGPSSDDKLRLETYEHLLDPFTNPAEQMTRYNRIKMIFPGMILIPTRLLLAAGVFSITNAIVMAALIGNKKKGSKVLDTSKDGKMAPKPLPRWRRFISQTAVKFGSRALLFCIGFHNVRVIGKPDPRATVFVANHTGPFEALAMCWVTGGCFISAIENRKVPFLGSILEGTQAIFVDRGNPLSREHTLSEIRRRAKEAKDWPPLVIFPEGTTHNGKSLLHFKQGAFQPGVPVQPVIVRHHYKHMNVAWSGVTEGMLQAFKRITSQWYNSMSIEYLPMYFPTEAEQQNAQMYADHVRRYMSDKSGIPCSKYSIDDYQILLYASKFGIAQEDALVGMDLLRREAHLSINDIKKFINLFRELGADRKGKVSYESFIAALELPDTKLAQETFHKLHEVRTATHLDATASTSANTDSEDAPIAFRDFLRSIAFVTRNVTTAERIQQAFEIVNIGNTQKITEEEVVACFAFASPESKPEQVKEIFKKMDADRRGFVDVIAFGTFMRANPMYMSLFEASRERERQRDPFNPVIQMLQRRAEGVPTTAAEFTEMVQKYRKRAADEFRAAESSNYF